MPASDAAGARHLLRALLRECTYLPDPAARSYTHHHVLIRFRDYHPEPDKNKNKNQEQKPPNPALSPRRLRGALKNAQKGLNFLRRANEGEKAPLQQLLLLVYGRSGRRRHQLMTTLLTPDPIMSENEAVDRRQAELSAALNSSDSIQGIPKAMAEAPRKEGRPHTYEIAPRYSKLRALLESQRNAARPVESSRSKLRSVRLEVPLTNAWMRPFPRRRERNMVINWYASTLDKLFPPLPEDEWMRLRDLVTGVRKWKGLKRRRPGVPSHMSAYDVAKLANISGIAGERFLALTCREHRLPETGSKADMLARLSKTATSRFQHADRWLARGSSDPTVLQMLLQDELETKKLPKRLPGKSRAQNITHRLLRHIWAKIFSQCPVLRWNQATQKWTVEWGSWEHLHSRPRVSSHTMSLFEGVDKKGQLLQSVPTKNTLARPLDTKPVEARH